MKWTKTPPKQIGWYWRRYTKKSLSDDLGTEIVFIRLYGDKLCIMNWEISTTHTEWAGPIPEPE